MSYGYYDPKGLEKFRITAVTEILCTDQGFSGGFNGYTQTSIAGESRINANWLKYISFVKLFKF